jgi:hypothetical protein
MIPTPEPQAWSDLSAQVNGLQHSFCVPGIAISLFDTIVEGRAHRAVVSESLELYRSETS